jgi:uncharacterized damage-inducible protein DinB
MLGMLRDLVHHKNHADAALLRTIAGHEPAASDTGLRSLLHHVILANRYWLCVFLGHPFDIDRESQVPESLEAVATLYRDTHRRETEWVMGLRESDLQRMLATPYFPARSFSLPQALIQVCMHSQGHRAQCAARLRSLGGHPPATDFIVWLKDRPAADWSQGPFGGNSGSDQL